MRQALVLLLISALSLPACAPALSSGIAGQPDLWRQHAEHIAPGTIVTIRMTSGDRFTGILIASDEAAIQVSPKTRVPEPVRTVRFDQIARLEVERKGNAMFAKAAAIGAGVGAGTFFGLLLLMAAVWDD